MREEESGREGEWKRRKVGERRVGEEESGGRKRVGEQSGKEDGGGIEHV